MRFTIDRARPRNAGLLDESRAQMHAYAVSGKRSEADRLIDDLKELSKKRYVSPYHVAGIYAGLQQNEQAFQWERERPILLGVLGALGG